MPCPHNKWSGQWHCPEMDEVKSRLLGGTMDEREISDKCPLIMTYGNGKSRGQHGKVPGSIMSRWWCQAGNRCWESW